MILLPPLSSIFDGGNILLDITFGVVIVMAVVYTSSNLTEVIILSMIGGALFTCFLSSVEVMQWSNVVLMLIFFVVVLGKIIYFVLGSKDIGLNEVFASTAGYLVLGLVAAPYFFLIETQIPGSFKLPEGAEFYDFLYFSYITLTSVGFGDIAPIHPVAKALTLVLCILGQLYLVILVGIIIGKYLAAESTKKQ